MGRYNLPGGKRGRGRPKKGLDEVIREDLKVVGLSEDLAQDRRLWRNKIRMDLRWQRSVSVVVSSCSGLVLVGVCRARMQVVLFF